MVVYNSPQFPAFFTNDSGINSPINLTDITSIAHMYSISKHLKLTNGMIVAVPNPDPAESTTIQAAIDTALHEAETLKISGSAITPYLLDRIEKLTGGKSLDSNISLVLNNAKVASQIAIAYSQINKIYASSDNYDPFPVKQSTGSTGASSSDAVSNIVSKVKPNKALVSYPVLVFGGAVVDIIARSQHPLVPGSSNPGSVRSSYGGVGRNIASNLARLGKSVRLVSVVCDDEQGRAIVHDAKAVGVDTSLLLTLPPKPAAKAGEEEKGVTRSVATATYLGIHKPDGDLFGGVADMSIFTYMTKAYIRSLTTHIMHSALIVVDANMSSEALSELVGIAWVYNVPILFEPTSDPKCVLPITTRTISKVS